MTLRTVARAAFPWWAKGVMKLAASRVKVDYKVLHAFGLARHGAMTEPRYALDVYRRHFDGVDFHAKSAGFTCLEMGPGDSAFTAVIAKSMGASRTWIVDVDSFASKQADGYRRMAETMRESGLQAPDLSGADSLEDVLTACNASYLTNGLASLRTLPDAGVDFIFSNTVLQHIRRPELSETLRQLRRIIHPQGVAVHSIDLRDMLGQSLNHLRFSQGVWESSWFRRAEFYTNRLCLPQWIESLEGAGFKCEVAELQQWDDLPMSRRRLAEPYRGMSEEALRPRTLRVVTYPN